MTKVETSRTNFYCEVTAREIAKREAVRPPSGGAFARFGYCDCQPRPHPQRTRASGAVALQLKPLDLSAVRIDSVHPEPRDQPAYRTARGTGLGAAKMTFQVFDDR